MDQADTQPRDSDEFVHTGPLTLPGFEQVLTRQLFRPVRSRFPGAADPYHLAWEHVPARRGLRIRFSKLDSASAEGVASLAAIVTCLRQPGSLVEVLFDRDSKMAEAWIESLGLAQIETNNWLPLPMSLSRPSPSLAGSLWRAELTTREDCATLGLLVADQVRQVLVELRHHGAQEVAGTTYTVVTEALLNIFQHAYKDGATKLAFGALTVAPYPSRSQFRRDAYVSAEELQWMDQFSSENGPLLEVAIADHGANIPSTLWAAFQSSQVGTVGGLPPLPLGSNAGELARARLHHEIALWAFDHSSTRKRLTDHPDDIARLNWRGLHRALNATARHSGSLIARSGQARTGFVFRKGESNSLKQSLRPGREFPGTAVVLRIPIVPVRKGRQGPAAKALAEQQPLAIKTLLRYDSPKAAKTEPLTRVVALAVPFITYETGAALRQALRQLPPQIVPVLLCARLTLNAGEELKAFDLPGTTHPEGLPRLIGFLDPTTNNLSWRFAGRIPEYARRLIVELEQTGYTAVRFVGPLEVFCRDLEAAFTPYIRSTEAGLRLVPHNSFVSDDLYERAVRLAFEQWQTDHKAAWIHNKPGTLVRTSHGRLVRRFASVLRLLHSSELICLCLGRMLVSAIDRAKRKAPNLALIADSPASYFIAHVLLQEQERNIELILLNPKQSMTRLNSQFLIFSDVVNRGDTIRRAVSSNPLCMGSIACLRLVTGSQQPLANLTTLLALPFDPGEASSEIEGQSARILEVDPATNVPVGRDWEPDFRIGVTPERSRFALDNPSLFRHGIHALGPRIHTISFDTHLLVASHSAKVSKWCCDELESVLGPESPPADVVFVTRAEGAANGLVPPLAESVLHRFPQSVGRTYHLLLPTARGLESEVFGQSSIDRSDGVVELRASRLFGPTGVTWGNSVLVYLDDATVTGDSLRQFLLHMLGSPMPDTPKAIVAIPLVSRFSPPEELFFAKLCSRLASGDNDIAFYFRPLFRLPIQPFDALERTRVHRIVVALRTEVSRLDDDMARHGSRLAECLAHAAAGGPPLQHPFLGQPADATPLSSQSLAIRHLFALHEHGVGVVGSLLRQLLAALRGEDFTLLSLLATEPHLLGLAPLKNECHRDLTTLAERALLGSTDRAVKSDALLVLAAQRRLVKSLPSVLTGIRADYDLTLTTLSLLFSLAHEPDLWAACEPAVIAALAQESPGMARDHLLYLSSALRSFSHVRHTPAVTSEHEARKSLLTLIARMSYHGDGLTAFNRVTTWLESRPDVRNGKRGDEVRQLLQDAMRVTHSDVLPGVDGLVFWARRHSAAAVESVSKLLFTLRTDLGRLDNFANGLSYAPVGAAAVGTVSDLWLGFRARSLQRSTDVVLSQRLLADELSLEYFLPRFFSLPFEIVTRLATEGGDVLVGWERGEPGPKHLLVVSPYPRDIIGRLCELLFADMRHHGVPKSLKVSFSLVTEGGSPGLRLRFSDTTAVGRPAGTGRSQDLVRRLADQYGLGFSPDREAIPGRTYSAVVECPNVWPIELD